MEESGLVPEELQGKRNVECDNSKLQLNTPPTLSGLGPIQAVSFQNHLRLGGKTEEQCILGVLIHIIQLSSGVN